VIPGSVIVNTGGTLMHLSKGRYAATMHRVNTTLIPYGDDRVSLPFFLLPKFEGPLTPFGSSVAEEAEEADEEAGAGAGVGGGGGTGYEMERDRGVNASVNRMGTFPQVTKRWWADEFKELGATQRAEVMKETASALRLAKIRGKRNSSREGGEGEQAVAAAAAVTRSGAAARSGGAASVSSSSRGGGEARL
jgi:hypothetical protein